MPYIGIKNFDGPEGSNPTEEGLYLKNGTVYLFYFNPSGEACWDYQFSLDQYKEPNKKVYNNALEAGLRLEDRVHDAEVKVKEAQDSIKRIKSEYESKLDTQKNTHRAQLEAHTAQKFTMDDVLKTIAVVINPQHLATAVATKEINLVAANGANNS